MLCVSMFILNAAMAAVGPQSINFTFNATDSEGWIVSSGGSIISVENGVANVQMKQQDGGKYRADFQYQKAGTYTFDKAKDIVWAIKLTAPLPGTKNSRKMEINYKNAGNTDTWINGISGPSGSLNCADGGVIYYFNLGADGLKKLDPVQDGDVKINKIHFIMADATELTDETAKYAVDWVATFTSVNDLKAFQDWKDEKIDTASPYLELCFRPKSDNSGYDSSTPLNGFKDTDFEGNYQARFFAVEYFWVENVDVTGMTYTLSVTTLGGGGTSELAVWDFPYQVNNFISAADINTYATAVVGVAPGSSDDADKKEPIASSQCTNSVWSFTIPASSLTPLATRGDKTLVGVLITSKNITTTPGGKFASSSHAEKDGPSLQQAPIVNTTQNKVETTLADAVANANVGDVITIYGDVTISGGRLEIKKELTIQGATGAEKIICGVPVNTIMVLANGNEADYTVTFKNLIVDGQNKVRSIQTFDINGKAKMRFDGVSVINTTYSKVTGDVKCAGSNIILTGNNSFPTGIYLNMNKRVDHQGATHTTPVKLILAADYKEDYAIVLNCDKPELYEAVDAAGVVGWELYAAQSGTKYELKAKKYCQYHLVVSPKAGMATLVLGFDAELPVGVKAYTLTNDGTVNIYATEVERIEANQPVLIIAEPATYTFNGEAGVANNEQPTPTNGCLIGTYEQINVPEGGVGKYNYVLANPDPGDGIGFYKVKGNEIIIAKNRAYLSCTYDTQANEANNAPLRIKFGGQMATEIETIDANSQAEKILKEGVLYIRKAGKIYRVDGQLVE